MFQFGSGDVYWNLWVDRLRRSFSGTAKWHFKTLQICFGTLMNWEDAVPPFWIPVAKWHDKSTICCRKGAKDSKEDPYFLLDRLSVTFSCLIQNVENWLCNCGNSICLAGFFTAGWPVADTSEMPKVFWCVQLTHVFPFTSLESTRQPFFFGCNYGSCGHYVRYWNRQQRWPTHLWLSSLLDLVLDSLASREFCFYFWCFQSVKKRLKQFVGWVCCLKTFQSKKRKHKQKTKKK